MNSEKEYIDRDAVKDAVSFVFKNIGLPSGSARVLNYLARKLEIIPASDAKPVVHAGFVRFADGTWHCSNCIDELPVDDSDFQPDHKAYREKNMAYCNYCGAKLDAGASALLPERTEGKF